MIFIVLAAFYFISDSAKDDYDYDYEDYIFSAILLYVDIVILLK